MRLSDIQPWLRWLQTAQVSGQSPLDRTTIRFDEPVAMGAVTALLADHAGLLAHLERWGVSVHPILGRSEPGIWALVRDVLIALPTVRDLVIEDPVPHEVAAAALSEALRHHGDAMHTLRCEHDPEGRSLLRTILTQLPALTDLTLTPTDAEWRALAGLAALPPGLARLCLGGHWSDGTASHPVRGGTRSCSPQPCAPWSWRR